MISYAFAINEKGGSRFIDIVRKPSIAFYILDEIVMGGMVLETNISEWCLRVDAALCALSALCERAADYFIPTWPPDAILQAINDQEKMHKDSMKKAPSETVDKISTQLGAGRW